MKVEREKFHGKWVVGSSMLWSLGLDWGKKKKGNKEKEEEKLWGLAWHMQCRWSVKWENRLEMEGWTGPSHAGLRDAWAKPRDRFSFLLLILIQYLLWSNPLLIQLSFFFKQLIYSSNFSNSYKTNKTLLKS